MMMDHSHMSSLVDFPLHMSSLWCQECVNSLLKQAFGVKSSIVILKAKLVKGKYKSSSQWLSSPEFDHIFPYSSKNKANLSTR